MRHELKLVALLVHGFLLFNSIIVGETQCPLTLTKFQTPEVHACASASGDSLNDFESAACCIGALVVYTQALAYHSNKTYGHPLFLNKTDQAACADEMEREKFVDNSRCSFRPPTFTANAGPCLVEYETSLLVKQVNSDHSVALEQMFKACTSVEEEEKSCAECRYSFLQNQKVLANALNDSQVNCGLALLVYLASHNIEDQEWVNRFYWCLEVPFTAARLYSGKRTGVLVPLLATLLASIGLVGFLVLLIHVRKKYVERFKGEGSEGSLEPNVDLKIEYMQKQMCDVPGVSQGSLYTFSAKELMKATDNFSSKNFIGEGSAGKVFKGALPSGQLVAIKHIMNEKKLDTFYKEVENLTKVRHTNLVTLLGYCQTPNEHLLVYEYCSKGNLWHYLFGNGPVLTWEQRINIAVGSARGIWYLHLYPGGYIVHRDIKPTNILLNEHMEAKVSDFGLSRFIAIEESRVITEVKGTAGYLDPEYLSLGTLTLASDVYSFGIVLLELISGRRPIELSLNLTKKLPLVKQANLVMEGGEDLSLLIDPRLEGCYSETAFRKMTEIAVQCTSERAAQRPSMSNVLQGLEEAWRVARLESPPRRSLRATPMMPSGTWSPLTLGTPLEDGQVWESKSFDVLESRTFDEHSTPER